MLSRFQSEFVGAERKSLEIFLDDNRSVDYLEKKGYLRNKKVMGDEVLFPTEELLINQRVGKRGNHV